MNYGHTVYAIDGLESFAHDDREIASELGIGDVIGDDSGPETYDYSDASAPAVDTLTQIVDSVQNSVPSYAAPSSAPLPVPLTNTSLGQAASAGLPQTVTPLPAPSPPSVPSKPSGPSKPTAKKNAWLPWVIGGAAVIVVGGGIAVAVSMSGKKKGRRRR